MVFYMMAFMLTNVVEQSFFVHKACTVNHGFNETICKNITANEYEEYNKEVQVSNKSNIIVLQGWKSY